MKTGIELIATERQEQIEKHKWNDSHYKYDELVLLAKFCLYDDDDAEKDELYEYLLTTINFAKENLDKISKKPYKERIVVAAALLAAQLDHLNEIENKQVYTNNI
jgi:hypothetical protein